MALNGMRGGIEAVSARGLKLYAVRISNGTGMAIGGGTRGGAIYTLNTPTTVSQGSISTSTATLGGAVYCETNASDTSTTADTIKIDSVGFNRNSVRWGARLLNSNC